MEPAGRALRLDDVARELRQPILRYLERYAGDRALAEDLAQETLVRMQRGLASFDARSTLKTWAFSIATRVAADHFRQPEHRHRVVDLYETDEPRDPGPDIDERMIIDEMSECVRQVIASLPEAHRAALILHDLEDMTAAQVAQTCECSAATAKIRIHRARQRLKEALERECDFYRDGEGVFRCDRKAGPDAC